MCLLPIAAVRSRSTAADASDRAIAAESVGRFPPVRRPIVVAEIVCLLCARSTGTAIAERWPPVGPILFQAADARERSWSTPGGDCAVWCVAATLRMTELTVRTNV